MKRGGFKFSAVLAILLANLAMVNCSSYQDPTPAPVSTTKPVITSVDPASGYGGNINTQVTITGQNFKEDLNSNTIKFNGVTATVVAATKTQLITRIPAGATTGKLSVTVDNSTGTSAADFTVLVPETITSFAPTSGPVGTIVTITGTNFSVTLTDNVVLFNGHEATVTSATTTSLVVTVPAGATTGRISVTINNVDAVSATDFTVL